MNQEDLLKIVKQTLECLNLKDWNVEVTKTFHHPGYTILLYKIIPERDLVTLSWQQIAEKIVGTNVSNKK